jgi:dephospho-CoA kinase
MAALSIYANFHYTFSMRILITGIAGTGKTTALAELQKHGYVVIDLDATGICRWRNKETQEVTEYGPDGRDIEWLNLHGWYCDIPTLQKLLSCIREDKDVFVAGCSENIEEVAKEFNKIIVLNASDLVIRNRLNARTNNHFAKKEDEQDFIFEQSRYLMQKLKDFVEVDTDKTPAEITDIILNNLVK